LGALSRNSLRGGRLQLFLLRDQQQRPKSGSKGLEIAGKVDMDGLVSLLLQSE
jgi:hypothetical protein